MSILDRKRYNQFYARVDGCCCVYCGGVATTADHIPPINSVASRGTIYFNSHGIPLVKVPACSRCNGLLGALALDTFEARQNFLFTNYKISSGLLGNFTGRKEIENPNPKKDRTSDLAIGGKVKQLRLDMGLSQTKFWGKLGIQQGTGARYELGCHTIPAVVIDRLANVFTCL